MLLISHGQASVERGFSINKYCSTVNQSEGNLVARRVVRDHVNYEGGIDNIQITPGLLRACKSAHRKYHERLKADKEKNAQKEKNTKKDKLKEEIAVKKQHIKVNEELIQSMNDDMRRTLKLGNDKEKTKVVNSHLLIAQISQSMENIATKEEEVVKLKDELEELIVRSKRI